MTRKNKTLLPLPWPVIAGILLGTGALHLIQWAAFRESQSYETLATYSCSVSEVQPWNGEHGEMSINCGDLELYTDNSREFASIAAQLSDPENDGTLTCRKRRGNLTEEVDYWCGTPTEDN